MKRPNVIFPKSRLVRETFRRVPVDSGLPSPGCEHCSRVADGLMSCCPFHFPNTGFTSRPDGHEEVFYSVTVDMAGLDSMAHKAARSKGGKSSDGPLVVRILERRKLS